MKPPACDPVLDRLGVEPEVDELRMRHDLVLPLRQRPQPGGPA
jgi:hypothetical protein